MKPTTWFLFAAALASTAGCGSSAETAAGPSGAAGATSGTGAGGPTGTSGSGNGSTGSGDPGETVTLKMTPFTVPSGGEVYKCQNFANPFGAEVEISEFESHMTEGSHHLLLFYNEGGGDKPIEDCSGLEFAATPYSTQLPDDTVTYPEGVAALVKPTTGMRMQSHYLNTSASDLTANVSLTFHLAKPGTVTAHAGVLFVVELQIYVPPGQTQVVKHDCTLPYDMNLIKASSHMHKHGTHFTSTIGGASIFETTQWSDPKPALFDPPRSVKGGDPLHFECTFVNNGTSTLTFGESAENNEMCIFGGAYFPIPDGGDVTVGCN